MNTTPVLTTDLPGGNGEFLDWDAAAGRLTVRPELRGGSPYRGWFFFRIEGLAPGRPLALSVIENDFAGLAVWSEQPDGPWRQFESFHKDTSKQFSYTLQPSGKTLYVAMMPPYRLEHLQRFMREVEASPDVSVHQGWTSEEGRPGHVLRVASGTPRPDRPRIWITARMHAFEAVSSWTAEGLLRWALSADPAALWLRENAELHVAPLVDVDSVECGGTGKHRAPVCFARDAGPSPHWAAIRCLVETWEREGPPDFYLDLHGPGGEIRNIYFYVPVPEWTTSAHEADLMRFTGLLAADPAAAMRYRGFLYRCPPKPDHLGQPMSGTAYLHLHRRYFGHGRLRLAIASETPWGFPGYDREAFLRAGADYGRAIARFLRGDPSPAPAPVSTTP